VAVALVAAAITLLRSDTLAARATTQTLGGPDRYLTHVSTDKPIYRPGERVYIRAVLLNARDHTPLRAGANVRAMIQIKGPKGDTVGQGSVASQDSVVAFQWPVPAGQPGGEYTIKVTYPWHGQPPAERKFDIRAYRPPRLKSQIVFLRDGYGPGDRVGATLHVERAEGGFPQGAKVTAIARVDGAEVHKGAARVDARGNCTVHFKLPARIARGEGTLAMVIEDGGVVETAAKTIPILLQTVDLNLYPEGGNLVAGLPTRVYVEARTPAKKPADIAGVVVDAQGRQVATSRTKHEGRGRFAFTPRKGGRYTLKIAEPAGIKTTYPLPAVQDEGAVIRALEDRTRKGENVRLGVGSTSGGMLTVTLTRREVEVSTLTWNSTPGVIADVVLTPPATADGVLVATVWDEKGKPLAERLIYRQPAREVRVSVKAQKPSYVPGDTAKLTIKTTDAAGKPLSAVVGLTITDDSVLEMIEKREQAPRLPIMVLLESDVQELADAHVYLDEANPKAPLAIDLLLGTQGWRRFAFVDPAKFLKEHRDKARRVLALRMATVRERRLRLRGARGGGRPGAAAGAEIIIEDAAVRLGVPAPDGAAWADGQGKGRAPRVVAKMPGPSRPASQTAGQARAELAQALREAPEEPALRLRADRLKSQGDIASRRLVRSNLVPIRVYAHKVRPNRKPNDRVDFTETLYWNAGLKTDAKTGEATVSFALSDSVTAFRVFADAFGADGALGQGTSTVESVEPFYIEPKMPLEVAAGDVIELPVSFVNGIESPLVHTTISIKTHAEFQVSGLDPIDLGPNARERRIVRIKVGHLNGPADFILHAKADAYSDKVTRKLHVKPLGFPVEVALGGMTATNGSVSHTIVIPADVVARSVTTNVAVYPTPLANLTQALERLIREPHGCFEQTSSTTYPLVMAQQYFLTHAGVDPSLIERSRAKLEQGYRRLVSFECKKRGYEWFGADPGHEALTAYGVLEFTDMAQVREVDAGMLARSRQWLLKARDGKGGFTRKRRALHTWVTDRDCSNAYILWALLESGEKGLAPEVASLTAAAGKSKNSYVHALAANVLALAGQKAEAGKLMDRLVAKQTNDGWVDGATASIVGSGGQALRIETTSLAILAWLRDPAYAGAVEKGVRYIANSCKAGRFGSTQSTVLALRAIVSYDKSRARPKAPGAVRVYVDGKPVGEGVRFDEQTQGAIKLPNISELLEPGEHQVELRMQDGSAMPYSLAVNYNTTRPASAKECKVGLNVALSDRRVAEGAVTEANVTVTNLADQTTPMTVAIVGIPGGLEPRHDQLKELVKAGRIAAYEVIGRDVVLYWRSLTPGQRIQLPISCVAAVPGTYTGPASRAYLYYTDEFKSWVAGLNVTITPRAQ